MLHNILLARHCLKKNIIRSAVKSVIQNNYKKMSVEAISCGTSSVKTPLNAYFHHYLNLKLPKDKIFATYVWIDGSGIMMRSKDRVLNRTCDVSKVPKWAFDGSSTGQATTNDSDVVLAPVAIYKDPLREYPNILVLCETYYSNGDPTKTNHRHHCAKVLSQISDQVPWFGIEQEYTIFDSDMWPLGWPKIRGFPETKSEYSYCGIGPYVAGREMVECHARACVYSGMDYRGCNAEVMKSSWEFQVGTTMGIKAADDLLIGRYLLSRISEHFGMIISYHPKPMGKNQPGIGCHHNFSVIKMREAEGLAEIERVCKALCDTHDTCLTKYGSGDGQENMKRLTGEFETASFKECKWGVADRSASIRLQKSVKANKKGYLEDRRPAGDCDPYRVCAVLGEKCLSSIGNVKS